MIPRRLIDSLEHHCIPYDLRLHSRAVTAQEVAKTLHVPGRRVVKSVLVEAGGKIWIAVLPAIAFVDWERLATSLGVPAVRPLRETEFQGLFPDCEAGAEPPFGALYGLPIIVDSTLVEAGRLIVRAGSHEEAIEIDYDDFSRLENELHVGAFSRASSDAGQPWSDWPEVGTLQT